MPRVISLLTLLFLFLWPSVALAHEGTEISVQGEVRADGSIRLKGAEFAPNDIVRIELRKEGVEPILLGNLHADAKGAFEETLHIPASVTPGIYRLAADGKDSATTTVTVLSGVGGPAAEPNEGTLGEIPRDRSTGETLGLAAFTALLAAGGFAALWFGRTRVHSGGT